MTDPSSWFEDGTVSGFDGSSGSLNRNQFKLVRTTPGVVDLNGITRMQIDLPGRDTRLRAMVPLRVEYDDYFLAQQRGNDITVQMFVAPQISGMSAVPSINEIIQMAAWSGQIARSNVWATDNPPPVANGRNMYFYIDGPTSQFLNNVSMRGKFWVLLIPVEARKSDAPNHVRGYLSSYNSQQSKAVSVWLNRPPAAPTITSPASGGVVASGTALDFTLALSDPDSVGTGPVRADLAGVQVQYAPRPTAANPNPQWADLPFARRTGPLVAGPGWYITGANGSNAATDALQQLWLNQTVKIKCGSNNLTAGMGILPAGSWQLRARVFDYGHPWPSAVKPLGSTSGDLTPDNYYGTNSSLWSEPITVSISTQVPPPLLTHPINSTAVVAGSPITFAWQYRNTARPPFPQASRTIQYRKNGATDWTTLVTGASASPTHTGLGPLVGQQYIADPGFEEGTLGGWVGGLGSGGVLTELENSSAPTRSGAHALLMMAWSQDSGQAEQVFPLRPQDTDFAFRAYMSPSMPGVSTISAVLTWRDAAGGAISSTTLTSAAPSGVWTALETSALLTRPAGAVSVGVVLKSTTAPGTDPFMFTSIDDLSLTGYGTERAPLFEESTEYEWRVQVTDSDGFLSDYSLPARFWVVPAPASGTVRPLPGNTLDGATLGCGTHRIMVYRRGGKDFVGEIKNCSYIDWHRLRDDISTSKIVVSDWDIDCGNLLSQLQSWAYEIVIIRDNGFSQDRVWEGPITLLTYEEETVTIHAKDVMAYAYRRILMQAMNDQKVGDSVTSRAARVLQNAFAPDDPNILPYLQVLSNEDDAKQYRVTPAFSRTAFEEVDDMASNAGLDYTAVGRAILLWGTKSAIGQLPEFTDADLGAVPIVSEYGMRMANVYSVSDGNGLYGVATRGGITATGGLVSGNDEIYGRVEMLSSTWASDSGEETGTYTQEDAQKVVASFTNSSERSIASRYPPPVVVRIPDNTSLSPKAVISINHLVPGVLIPLNSTGTLRKVRASQKLDSVKVIEQAGAETITITLSPFARNDADIADGGEE